ncbi:MAG: DEAD/DEAH box helicase [Parvularculales bacterium]
MINIAINNHKLIVKDETLKLFNWEHRTFFIVLLDFEEDKEQCQYSLSDKNNFSEVIKDVVLYFEEENEKYEVDENVQKIISKIKKQEEDFNQAKSNIDKNVSVSLTDSFKRQLKPYQEEGVKHFLKISNGANFSVPGSGKTTMVYAYYNQLKLQQVVEKIFVVGPYSSFMPWEEESKECFGHKLKTVRLSGNNRERSYFQSTNYELFLCGYQTVVNDLRSIISLCEQHKFLLVVDESHNIKNINGVWANALLEIAPYAERRVILSGTPMPHGYIDLWSQMTFLWPDNKILHVKAVYQNRCKDENQQERIKEDIRPFFYRVKKSDLRLPKQNFTREKYELKPIQAQIYSALSKKLISDLDLQIEDRMKLRQWRKAKIVRLLQVASNPALLNKYSDEFEIPALSADGTSLIDLIDKYSKFEEPAKFDIAISLVKKLLSEDRKVLLWTSFVHNIKMLQIKCNEQNIPYYSIYGAIPKDDSADVYFNREKQIRSFKKTNTPSLLIANPAACAESISLHTVCNNAIYLDRTFNCGQFLQSLDRIHRIGLKDQANYHILIAKSTIDETIDRRLEEKEEAMRNLLEDDVPLGDYEEQEDVTTEDFEATVADIISQGQK